MTLITRKPTLLLCTLLTALTLITPIGRLARHTELSYNEGWNVAAAMRLTPGASQNPQLPVTTGTSPVPTACCQTELYPTAWGWTTVNYPALSFAVLAALHSVTGEYLVTARIVSLLSLFACAALLGLIARALGTSRHVAALTALLCAATLAVCAIDYAGVDDPQLLGDALFLLALLTYLRPVPHVRILGHGSPPPHPASPNLPTSPTEPPVQTFGLGLRTRSRATPSATQASVPHVRILGHGFSPTSQRTTPTYPTLALTAALFALAGSVKQSPIDIPIAVLIDLFFLSRKKAAWFTACGLVFGTLALLASRHIGGPWLIPQLLLGRLYSVTKARDVAIFVLGPMLLPFLLAGYTAWQLRHDPRRRIAAVLLVTSIAIGTYFGGGSGVAGNALFTTLLAITLLLGLSQCDGLQHGTIQVTNSSLSKDVSFRPERSVAEKPAFRHLSIPDELSFRPERSATQEPASPEPTLPNEMSFRPERSVVEKPAFLSRAANSPWPGAPPSSRPHTVQTSTHSPARVRWVPRLASTPSLKLWLPVLLFLWLLIPALVQGIANPIATLRETRAAETRFTTAAILLQNHPGPALCESILLCLQAGKPYIYDPFNSTRLLLQGKLSQSALLADIAAHHYSAIQLHAPAIQPDGLFRERFTPNTLAAIQTHYTLALQTPDMAIYLPQTTTSTAIKAVSR